MEGFWKRWTVGTLGFALVVGWAMPTLLLGEAEALGSGPDPMQMIYSCREAYKSVKDFTATILRRERVKGELCSQETIFMKFRNNPFSIYMQWVKEPHKAREVIYVEGQNGNKILAHEIVGPLNIMMKVDPNAPEAVNESRHRITDSGIGKAIESLIRVCEAAQKAGDLKLFYVGEYTVDSRPTEVLLRMLPQKPGYPYHLVVLHIDREMKLPVKFVSLNWNYEVETVFEYSGLKLNVGLTDADFSTRNKEYNYPGMLPLATPRILWPSR
jgi:hypothetical protein